MKSDDPPFFPVGSEISAKFKGGYYAATVKEVERNLKCRVKFKDAKGGSAVVDEQSVKGALYVGADVEVTRPKTDRTVVAVIQSVKDGSLYTVVFDDEEERIVRRTQICTTGGNCSSVPEVADSKKASDTKNGECPKRTRGRPKQVVQNVEPSANDYFRDGPRIALWPPVQIPFVALNDISNLVTPSSVLSYRSRCAMYSASPMVFKTNRKTRQPIRNQSVVEAKLDSIKRDGLADAKKAAPKKTNSRKKVTEKQESTTTDLKKAKSKKTKALKDKASTTKKPAKPKKMTWHGRNERDARLQTLVQSIDVKSNDYFRDKPTLPMPMLPLVDFSDISGMNTPNSIISYRSRTALDSSASTPNLDHSDAEVKIRLGSEARKRANRYVTQMQPIIAKAMSAKVKQSATAGTPKPRQKRLKRSRFTLISQNMPWADAAKNSNSTEDADETDTDDYYSDNDV